MVHDYAETLANTRFSAFDLLPRIRALTSRSRDEIRSLPWLVRNAEVGSSSLLTSTIYAKDVHRGGAARTAAKVDHTG